MRVIYTDEMIKLSEMVKPYRTIVNMEIGWKPGTPHEIIKADEKLMKLLSEKMERAKEF